MKKIILLSILGLMSFVSCKKEEEVKIVEDAQQTAQPFSGEDWLKQRVGNQSQQQQQQPVQQQTQQTQQATQTAPGMNPPHGQTGHLCEIAVGAPLNSAPSTKPQVVPQATPQVVPQKPVMNVNSNNGGTTIVGTSTPPGMNPPHGQEGHLCEIAVGAPLPKK